MKTVLIGSFMGTVKVSPLGVSNRIMVIFFAEFLKTRI